MVSIIEMGVSGWWRGKIGWNVGSFPSQCVKRINSSSDVISTREELPYIPPGPYSPQRPSKWDASYIYERNVKVSCAGGNNVTQLSLWLKTVFFYFLLLWFLYSLNK